jgi:hypothetical protein
MSSSPTKITPPGPLEKERRLAEIKRDAEAGRELKAVGIRPAGAPFPVASPETGYYGIPLLKEPSWSWEIPLYFFVGGAAGAAAVVGAIADYTGADRKLVRDARWIAAAGCVLSPLLLIKDLGQPRRFLNMLRVFKPQSPMSMGVWTLLAFSGGASAAAFADFLQERYGSSLPLRILENAGQAASMLFGMPLSSYTGVLIGATTIPAWNENVAHLPIHFSMSGLGAGVGLLELMGNQKSRALQTLGMGAALSECWEGWRLERAGASANRPLKHGMSGTVTRLGGLLSGPLAVGLRLLSLLSGKRRRSRFRRWAGVSSVAGSLITRAGWIQAGHASARDWKQPLNIPVDRRKP